MSGQWSKVQVLTVTPEGLSMAPGKTVDTQYYKGVLL